MDTRTAVVVDDFPLWLLACEQLLSRLGFDALGTTTKPDEALELVRAKQPDLLIVGLDSAERSSGESLAIVSRAREISPRTRVVVFAVHDDPRAVEAAFTVGAAAFCLKTSDPDDLAAAIRQAFDHSIYLAPGRAGGSQPRVETAAETATPELTRREEDVLRLVAEGYSNAQLAKMLWVTEQTIKFHLSNIYRKLNVANRTEASRWAQLHGLLGQPSRPEGKPDDGVDSTTKGMRNA